MSKYKVGDKIVMEITKIFSDNFGTKDYIVKGFTRCGENCLSEHSEPLSTYTLPLEAKIRRQAEEITRLLAEIVKLKKDFKDIEPLEAKIKRQAKEITRLLAENKELKEENKKLLCKVDSYELYGDQHEEEYNQAFNQGAEAAWELAKKFVLYGEDAYSGKELKEIFDCTHTQEIMRNYTYPEAVAKVSQWEKAKEEIKVGDVLEYIADNNVKCVVTKPHSSNMAYLVFNDGSAGLSELDNLRKTDRHTDIDSFLKQIGEE